MRRCSPNEFGHYRRASQSARLLRPASALTSKDREEIRANLPALLALLAQPAKTVERYVPAAEKAVKVAGGEPWELREVVQMMADVDTIVGRLGVDGRDPEIMEAVARVVAAFEMRDQETVRFACSEMVAVAHRLVAQVRIQNANNDR
jgi:hypothetical protein